MSISEIIPSDLQGVFLQITVENNFALLTSENAYIRRLSLTPDSSPNLNDLIIAWYELDGVPIFHGCNEDKSLFPKVHPRWPEYGDRALTIGELVRRMRGDAQIHPFHKVTSMRTNPPNNETYPAYHVGDGKLLLLDGAHRCMSLARAQYDYHIEFAVIYGPIDHRIIPDLAVFER